MNTVNIRDSAPRIYAFRRYAPQKKLTKPDRSIKHAYKFSIDMPPSRYALQKMFTKPDRPRAPSVLKRNTSVSIGLIFGAFPYCSICLTLTFTHLFFTQWSFLDFINFIEYRRLQWNFRLIKRHSLLIDLSLD